MACTILLDVMVSVMLFGGLWALSFSIWLSHLLFLLLVLSYCGSPLLIGESIIIIINATHTTEVQVEYSTFQYKCQAYPYHNKAKYTLLSKKKCINKKSKEKNIKSSK